MGCRKCCGRLVRTHHYGNCLCTALWRFVRTRNGGCAVLYKITALPYIAVQIREGVVASDP
jgi:hypothetical protein